MSNTNPTLYCLKCGYNLTGNTSGRCPECGNAFDPARLRADIDKLAGVTAGRVFRQVYIPAMVLAVVLVTALSVVMLFDYRLNEYYLAALWVLLGTPPVIYLIHHNWRFTQRLALRRMTRSQAGLNQSRLRVFRMACCALLLSGQAVLGVFLTAAGCFGVCMGVLWQGGPFR